MREKWDPPDDGLRKAFIRYVSELQPGQHHDLGKKEVARNRHFVDPEHRRHVELFDQVLRLVSLDTWLRDYKGLSRTSVEYYRAGRIRGKVSEEKRSAIEEAIRDSAEKLGFQNKLC